MNSKYPSAQRGLTLIELMISLVISLLISAVAIAVFVSGRNASRYSEALSRYQESMRFAQAAMTEDIRMVGYLGCRRDTDINSVAGITPTPIAGGSSFTQAINGVDNWTTTSSLSGTSSVQTGTDAIRLQFASRDGNQVTAAITPTAAIPVATSNATYTTTEPLLMADCTNAELFTASATTSNTITHGTAFLHSYSANISSVYRFTDRSYYINTSSQLMQSTNGGTAVVISDGIEDLQILYGLDTDTPADHIPNKYVSANNITTLADWKKIVAVRACLLVVSQDDGLTTQTTYTDCSGNSVALTDHKLRFPITFTVELRNRSS